MTDEDGRSNVEDTTDVHLHVDELSVDVGCDCCKGAVCSATAGMPDLSQSFMATEYCGDVGAFTATSEGQCHASDRNMAADHEPAWAHEDTVLCPFCKGYLRAEFGGSLGSPARFLLECEHCRWGRCYEGEDAQWAAELFHDAL